MGKITTRTVDVWTGPHGAQITYEQGGQVHLAWDLQSGEHWWGRNQRGTLDIRAFLAGVDYDYAARKLGVRLYEDCAAATLLSVKRHIIEWRRDGSYTKEQAREHWDVAVDYLDDLVFHTGHAAIMRWMDHQHIDDAHEMISTAPTSAFKRWKDEVWPAFRADLRADIVARPWEKVDPVAAEVEMAKRGVYEAEREIMIDQLERASLALEVLLGESMSQPPLWPSGEAPDSWDGLEKPDWMPAEAWELLTNSSPRDLERSLASGYNGHHPPGTLVVSRNDPSLHRHGYGPRLCGWYFGRTGNMGVLIPFRMDDSQGYKVRCVASWAVEPYRRCEDAG